jgi:uncharacterized protein YgbK (DUF1537 family)
MIIVLSDDYTGAAEIGGIGLRYGLAAEIHTGIGEIPGCDLLVVDTDTRSSRVGEAVRTIRETGQKLAGVKGVGIYKKVDSVLRGHVIEEVHSLMETLSLPAALIVSANPSRGRTLHDGQYFIDGTPLDRTQFARDPLHAVPSSRVLNWIARSGSLIPDLRRPGEGMPERGVVIGEVRTWKDLRNWAECAGPGILTAGAADFFSVLLEKEGRTRKESPVSPRRRSERILFVCGSASDTSREWVRKNRENSDNVCPLPSEIFRSRNEWDRRIREWADRVAEGFQNRSAMIVSIDEPVVMDMALTNRLRRAIADLTSLVLERVPVDGLILEGGATASAVMRRLGWTRCRIVEELAPGVVRMEVMTDTSCLVTIKPGSYAWPEGQVW